MANEPGYCLHKATGQILLHGSKRIFEFGTNMWASRCTVRKFKRQGLWRRPVSCLSGLVAEDPKRSRQYVNEHSKRLLRILPHP